MEWITQIAKEHGLFVALVAYILWYFDQLIKSMRQDNAERENKLLAIIDTLSEEVKDRLTKIEMKLGRRKED